MAAIRMHMVLILDLSGCENVHEAIVHFLQQADLNQVRPTVEIRGQRCMIRYSVDGPETRSGERTRGINGAGQGKEKSVEFGDNEARL